MHPPRPETVTLDKILITEELCQRSSRPSNWQAEAQAMQILARHLASGSETLLQNLVETAVELCQAGTAGISLLETTPDGAEIFRWAALAGTLAPYVGTTTPRNPSSCGVCLERGTPQLFSHPERYFTDLQTANPPIAEALVLPLISDGHALGTIWILSHGKGRQFDSEDVRVMTSLADFTAAVLLNQQQAQELLGANARLETLEERNRVVLEAAELATWDWHIPTNRVLWNEQHYRLLGLEPGQGEETPDSFMQLIHPEDLHAVSEQLERALSQCSIYEADFRILRADTGDIRWMSGYGRVMETQDGQATRMSGVMTDSTERKRVEARLREAQQRLELSLTGANLGIWTYNIATDEFWADDRAKHMHGHATHEVHTFAEAGANIHPEDRDRTQAAIAQALQDASRLQLEYRVIWPDGSVHGIASYAELIPTGEPDGGIFYGVAQDITERLQLEGDRSRTEAALRESEAKYRSLFESIDEAFCVLEILYDEQGAAVDLRYHETNRVFARQTGISNAEGKTAQELILNLEPFWIETYARVAQTGEPVRFENHVQATDHWFSVYASRVSGAGNRFVAVVFDDITERKRHESNLAFLAQTSADFAPLLSAEEIMERVGKRLADFLNLSRCNFSVVDEEADRIECIYAWRRDDSMPNLFGAHRISAFLNEEGRRHYAAGKLSVINDTGTCSMLAPTFERWDALGFGSIVDAPYLKDGRWKFLLTIARSEAGEWREDEVELIRELAERIYIRIERARAEKALRVSEEKYRTLFNLMDEAYAVVEVIPNEEGRWSDFRFLEVNPAFVKHTGMEYPVGQTATQLLGTPNPRWVEIYGQVAETGEAVRLELTEDTLNRVFDLNIFRLGGSGSCRVAVLFTDITARKRAEDDRNRAQEAMRAFFSNVSHEFRTPLTLLLSSIQDALSDLAHPLTSNQRSQLELAHRNAMRLLKLVNTLLDVSRIEAGRLQAVYEPTDLATFTTELASSFEPAIEQAGLQLVIDCSPLPQPVYVDCSMWETIVLNLLSNAFKFTFAGEITVRLTSASNSVELTVQDTGIGIPAAELLHLFERFYQVKGAKGRSFEGSGIGLSLVQELVKLHGGTIEVSSAEGEGSCFKVLIPTGFAHLPPKQIGSPQPLSSTTTGASTYVEEGLGWLPQEGEGDTGTGNQDFSSPSPLPLRLSPSPSSARILLVDDNADMRSYLKRLLTQRWQVETAANGAIALNLIQQHPPDLVLSDVMMPELDGLQLLQALRTHPQTKGIPVILLSARAGEEATVEGLEAGANDYLIKPFSARELVARIETHLQLARLRQERSANRLKTEFLMTVTHELQAPLAAILGWARLLQAQSFDPATTNRALATIERNATIEAKLIKNLLDVSSLLAGKVQLKPQLVNWVSLIQDVVATFRKAAEKKEIRLLETLSNVAVGDVVADGNRLKQIIANLLENAIKFTPQGGQVSIRLERIGSVIEIMVTDTGIGISPDFLPYVFDRFSQFEVPSRHSPGGMGVGLAIARLLVELHHGSIEVASEGEGQGATFTVRLPFKNSTQPNMDARPWE